MTNLHVVMTTETGERPSFSDVYIGNDPNTRQPYHTKARIVKDGGYKGTRQSEGGDWALMRLDDCLGKKVGWFQLWNDKSPRNFYFVLSVAIWPQRDKKRLYFHECQIIERRKDIPNSRGSVCFSESGTSGSPLITRDTNGVWRVVGMYMGVGKVYYNESGSSPFADAVVEISGIADLINSIIVKDF
jgi:hypothetical protein